MSLSAILTMLRKDIVHGPKNFFFIQAVITPIFTTLLVTLLFGSVLSGKPSLGFVLQGASELSTRLEQIDFLQSSEYRSVDELKADVLAGRLDVGLVMAADFDQACVEQGFDVFIIDKSACWSDFLLVELRGHLAGEILGKPTVGTDVGAGNAKLFIRHNGD